MIVSTVNILTRIVAVVVVAIVVIAAAVIVELALVVVSGKGKGNQEGEELDRYQEIATNHPVNCLLVLCASSFGESGAAAYLYRNTAKGVISTISAIHTIHVARLFAFCSKHAHRPASFLFYQWDHAYALTGFLFPG